jgi:hypothetical protein
MQHSHILCPTPSGKRKRKKKKRLLRRNWMTTIAGN